MMFHRSKQRILAALCTLAAVAAMVFSLAPPGAAAAGSSTLPCDTFSSGGTPCVAAYSSVRAMYGSYNGPLYRVTRASDGAAADIGVLAAGGYSNAAAQDAFCTADVCSVTKIYDQSANHNDLTVGPVGDAGSSDIPARADALPVTVAGHKAYGIMTLPRVGYRRTVGTGLAVNDQPESMYEVASGTNATNGCCSDFGNVETASKDTGAGHMDALIISSYCSASPCSGPGPWIQADLENGVFMGNGSSNPASQSLHSPFVTAVLRNDGQTSFALDGGDATQPTVPSIYSGALPSGYAPMKKEGGIVLGNGGDNSNAAPGAFFEGAITSGFASNATVAAVQSNIASVTYTGTSGGGPGVGVTGPGGKCLDVAGDDNGGNLTNVGLWDCLHDAVDQHWEYIRTPPLVYITGGTPEYADSLKTLGRCLDIKGNGTASGTQVELWDCDGAGGQQWVPQANGSLLNPPSGLCLTSPGGVTANGTVLDIEACNGGASQRFVISPGPVFQTQPINAPAGKCVDVYGANDGGNGTNVDIWDCKREANDQAWWQNANGSITTLGRCLDIKGNGTASGTQVELWDCDGAGGQQWTQQDDGTLLNPQSGLCLTDPAGNAANGTVLDIERCTGSASQKFFVSGGSPINAPAGKCADVAGSDPYGGFGFAVQMWDCIPTAVDQHWVHTPANTLETLTRCLDVAGNSTAPGSKVMFWNCNGVGGQQWLQQADGTLRNPQSGLCLTDPGGNTANGTQLDIEACTGATSQLFSYRSQAALTPGSEISLRATTSCCTNNFVRHQNGVAVLSPINGGNSALDKQDATWTVHAGLANSACLSFESKNFPNGYLRQQAGAIYQQQNDNTGQFASDATFCPTPGRSGHAISLASYANPALFLRHYNGHLYIASNGGPDPWDTTTSWSDDTTWTPTPAWAP
jgi:hypothetical protein